ncbi:MAG: tetratricopeptide repeat protein [Treponema sp.]|nr:tetratricopeptide repeat protein [Treponema sp.]MBR6912339.1 tetratricopeptide repeat protein [Treponema sp.]
MKTQFKAQLKSKNKLVIFSLLFSLILASCAKQGDVTIREAMEAYRRQNYEDAASLFKRALSEDTNYSEETICNFIANIYMAQGDFAEANVYIERFLEKKSDYRMLVQLGRNYKEIGDTKKAEESYNRAISLNPKKGEAYASLGSLQIAEGDFSSAVENLKKAAEFEPKIAVIHANLAVAYALSGDKDSAEDEFRTAKELKCENLEEFRDRAGM